MNNTEFVQSLYNMSDEELQATYRDKKEQRNEILNYIADILLIYTIINDVVSLSKSEKIKEGNKLIKLIVMFYKANRGNIVDDINNILINTSKKTFEYYSYNVKNKAIKDIIKNNFKDKHFSERVWENEKATAELLQKKVDDFINGNINVNKIKSEIDKAFNNSAYEVRRLVETEVSRVQAESFKKFCKETGVEKVKYNAQLEACEKCKSYDGQVYNLEDAPSLPRHPMCRCFYEIVE